MVATRFAINVVLLLVLRMRRLRAFLGHVGFEVVVTVVFAFSAQLFVIVDPWYCARLFGADAATVVVNNCADDAKMLLVLDVIVTVVHLTVPIRFTVLWAFDVSVVLGYIGIAYGLGSPAQGTALLMNIMVLTILVIAASVGLRSTERNRRMAFANLAMERTKRVEAEHQLDRYSRSMQKHRADDETQSDMQSLNTTRSDRLFGSMSAVLKSSGPSAIHMAELQRVAELGFSEHWLIPTAHLRPVASADAVIGYGGFGFVMKARYHGAVIAVKATVAIEGTLHLKALKTLANELRLLRRLRHPGIVLFYGACISPQTGELWLALEYVRGRALDDVVRLDPPAGLAYDDRFLLTRDVCHALMYLHAQEPCIVHGDIKGNNVLVESTGFVHRAKLADFGLSHIKSRFVEPMGGTQGWMAPEVLLQRDLDPAPSADVFSLGLLFYMTMTGQPPTRDLPGQQSWPERIPKSKECADLCEACTSADPQRRPSVQVVHEELLSIVPKVMRPDWGVSPQGVSDGRATLHEVINSTRARLRATGCCSPVFEGAVGSSCVEILTSAGTEVSAAVSEPPLIGLVPSGG